MGDRKSRQDDILAGFGPNERALLERIPLRPLRRLAAAAFRIKTRLMFTGWLQYLLPLLPIVLLVVLGGVAKLVGLSSVAIAFAVGAAGLLLIALFDLITVKYRIRFPEGRPRRNDHLNLFDLMRARHSCRSFQTRFMNDDDLAALLESVQRHTQAPTLSPTPVRLEYIRGRLTVWPVVNGTEFLVAIVPLPYERSSVIDVGRNLQKVVMEATRQGLATCWIGPGADHESLARHLGDRFDPEREQIICTCAVGYRSCYVPLFVRLFNGTMSKRLPLSELFFTDAELSVPIDDKASPYAQFGRSFEACRWSPSSYNGQTTRAALRSDAAGVIRSVEFFAVTSSRYYAPVALGIWCANWELGCEALGLKGRVELQPGPDGELVIPRRDLTWVPMVVEGAQAPHG